MVSEHMILLAVGLGLACGLALIVLWARRSQRAADQDTYALAYRTILDRLVAERQSQARRIGEAIEHYSHRLRLRGSTTDDRSHLRHMSAEVAVLLDDDALKVAVVEEMFRRFPELTRRYDRLVRRYPGLYRQHPELAPQCYEMLRRRVATRLECEELKGSDQIVRMEPPVGRQRGQAAAADDEMALLDDLDRSGLLDDTPRRRG
jgi:hypothetical protein